MWIKIEGNGEIFCDYNGKKYYLGPKERFKDVPHEVYTEIKKSRLAESEYVFPSSKEEYEEWMRSKLPKNNSNVNDENKQDQENDNNVEENNQDIKSFLKTIKTVDEKIEYIKQFIEGSGDVKTAKELCAVAKEDHPTSKRLDNLVSYLNEETEESQEEENDNQE